MLRRFILLAALLSLAVPTSGHAAGTKFSPPYKAGPSGGDTYNYISSDPASGDMTVVRYYPIPTSTGLGCGGNAGFANFEVSATAETPVSKVTLEYADAIIDPYTWVSVTVRSGDTFVRTSPAPQRGPVLGSGTIERTFDAPVTGDLTIWFGIQVGAACPNFDGGTATFTSVTLS